MYELPVSTTNSAHNGLYSCSRHWKSPSPT